MFSKAAKPDASPAAERKAPKPASLISQDLTLGDTAHIEGAIHAETVEVRGRVIGSITAKQVRLHGTAYVDGDITHEQLSVESGAFFQGRSLKFQRPTPVALAAPEAQSA